MGGPLHKYRYTSPASGAETVLKLNDADAARLGLTEDDLLPDTVGLRGEHGPELLSLPDGQDPAGAHGDGQEQEPPAQKEETPAETEAAPPARNKARTTAATKSAGRRRKPAGDGHGADPAVDVAVTAGAGPAGNDGGDGGSGGGD
ncbi:hypothetical protein AB0P17_15560 [Streptomyces sp. NPDC088124]|uniref:hypothetical protein n=1 Tax=Streptomyces sp. NPDC088124 TaxID=3154654 RepID=UPI003431BBBF